jgi:hypothetical protein
MKSLLKLGYLITVLAIHETYIINVKLSTLFIRLWELALSLSSIDMPSVNGILPPFGLTD